MLKYNICNKSWRILYPYDLTKIEVKVTLRLAVSQSVCRGFEPTLRLVTRYYFLSEYCCLKVAVLSLWGSLSDERSGSVISHSQSVAIVLFYVSRDNSIAVAASYRMDGGMAGARVLLRARFFSASTRTVEAHQAFFPVDIRVFFSGAWSGQLISN
jgi:hypothetical protein